MSRPDLETASTDLVDLGYIWSVLRRQRLFIGCMGLLFGGVVLLVTCLAGMKFVATGQLYLGEVDRKAAVASEPLGFDLSGGAEGKVGSEIEILQSRSLVKQAVLESGLNVWISAADHSYPSYWRWRKAGRDLDLIDGNLDLLRATHTTLAVTIREPQVFRVRMLEASQYELFSDDKCLGRGKLGEPFKTSQLALTLTQGTKGRPNTAAAYDLVVFPLDRVIAKAQFSLKVSVPKGGPLAESVGVVNLEFTDRSPRLAASFLHQLMLAYLNERQNWKTEDASAAESFVRDELNNVRDSLDRLQSQLADYRKNSGVAVLDDQAKAMIEQVGRYEEQRASARLQVAAFADMKRSLKSDNPSPGAFLVGEANDAVLASLSNALTEARQRQVELESRFHDAAPEVREQRIRVNSQLDAIRDYISSRQARAQENLATLTSLIGQFEEKLKKVPAAELGLAQLTRESEVYSKLYSFLLERQQQAAIVKASTLSKNRILDAPETPLWENSPNLLVRSSSIFVGFVLAAIFSLVRSLLGDKFQNQSDIRKFLGNIPVLAAVPKHQKTKAAIGVDWITQNPASRFAEEFRATRIKLCHWEENSHGKLLVVTSPSQADGKTTCANALAAVLGADGHSVLLVDAKLHRSPSISSESNGSDVGLGDVLAGHCSWDAAVRHAGKSNPKLHQSPLVSATNPQMLTAAELRRIFTEARDRYDFIILDCPSFPERSEALALAQIADLTISVIRPLVTSKRLASDHLSQLVGFAREFAVVINVAIPFRDTEPQIRRAHPQHFETPLQDSPVLEGEV